MQPLSLIFSLGSSRDPSHSQVGAAEQWDRDSSILDSLLPAPDLDSSEAPALEASLETGIVQLDTQELPGGAELLNKYYSGRAVAVAWLESNT